MALDTHNNIFGRTLNPLSPHSTAGGSSGGEGALLALRGSVLGVGTDVGGSIRVPAMCNGVYGVKPSAGRVPYAGQENGMPEGMGSVGIRACAGPLAGSVRDIALFFSAISSREPWKVDPDVVPSPWSSLSTIQPGRKFRIGVVRRDGITEPHPPILRLLDEVSSQLAGVGIEIIDLDPTVTPLWSKCQSLCNALFSLEGANHIFSLLESTSEPLSPWLTSRLRRKAPATLDKVMELYAKRTELQTQFLQILRQGGKEGGKEIDAFICPVAPHGVPEIDAYNTVSYTSAWNLLDYPAGVIPVRTFGEKDMEGKMLGEKAANGWDKVNMELCKYTPLIIGIGKGKGSGKMEDEE